MRRIVFLLVLNLLMFGCLPGSGQILDTIYLNSNVQQEEAFRVNSVGDTLLFVSIGGGSNLSGWRGLGLIELKTKTIDRSLLSNIWSLYEFVQISDSIWLCASGYFPDLVTINQNQLMIENSYPSPLPPDLFPEKMDTVDGALLSYVLRRADTNQSDWFLEVYQLDSTLSQAQQVQNQYVYGGSSMYDGQTIGFLEFTLDKRLNYGYHFGALKLGNQDFHALIFKHNSNGQIIDTVTHSLSNLPVPHPSWIQYNFRHVQMALGTTNLYYGFYGRNHFHVLVLDHEGKYKQVWNIPYGTGSLKAHLGSTQNLDNVKMHIGKNDDLILTMSWKTNYVTINQNTKATVVVLGKDGAIKWQKIFSEDPKYNYQHKRYDYIEFDKVIQLEDSSFVLFAKMYSNIGNGFDDADLDLRVIHLNKHGGYSLGEAEINTEFSRRITFYPNPGNGRFKLLNPVKADEVFVYDQLGRMVSQQGFNQNQMEINFSHLGVGLYQIVWLNDGDLVGSNQLIVE